MRLVRLGSVYCVVAETFSQTETIEERSKTVLLERTPASNWDDDPVAESAVKRFLSEPLQRYQRKSRARVRSDSLVRVL